MSTTIRLELGTRSYPIHIGRDLLADQALFETAVSGPTAAIISDDNIAPRYLDSVVAALSRRRLSTLILPAGEEHKQLATIDRIYDMLAADRHGRDTTLIALGGGVIGDMTGFAAATWQRGVNFVQVPTSLLAQVDASVGGKTGVNHPSGKNMIGSFHQPVAVVIDVATLDSLPEREYLSGIAEIIKYGLIRNAEFFAWLEQQMPRLQARDDEVLTEAIRISCLEKAAVVAADELEQEQRALLNLGHSFAHAVEAAEQYRGLLHGEAVGLGIAMAARLSVNLGLLGDGELQRIRALLATAQLPQSLPSGLDPRELLSLMYGDKKNRSGTIRLVLLRAIGEALLMDSPGDAPLLSTLESFVAR